MESAEPLMVTYDGPVCRIRLNRADKLNALNLAIRDGLRRELDRLEDDAATRVLVLSGNGRAFSAGVDLGSFSAQPAPADAAPSDALAERHEAGHWQRLLDQLERTPQVTVASLHGHCIGGAALVAAACDLRIGADDLQVRIPELALHIPLTWAGLPRLQREIGLPLTRDLVLTGRAMKADEALRSGFIQRLVAGSDLDAATNRLIDEVIAMPALPTALTRAALSALSRDQLGSSAWADADLLRWSMREPRS